MKNRWIASGLAFPGFLGGLGLHKFYLGQYVAGGFYLVFSWTFIPTIFSVFDFVSLLLMSDEEFDDRYNYRQIAAEKYADNISLPKKKDITNALLDLKKLYEQGVLTAEEYEEKRQKLLSEL